jgi:hypothetical protein
MLDVKAGIMWMAIFITLAIVAVFVGGAYGMIAFLVVLAIALFIGFSCILIILGEIRDALAGANHCARPEDIIEQQS